LVCVMDIWYFKSCLLNLSTVWYILYSLGTSFYHFWYVEPRKICQP
jgi:hypothetical protein